jgi:hypothetical protein
VTVIGTPPYTAARIKWSAPGVEYAGETADPEPPFADTLVLTTRPFPVVVNREYLPDLNEVVALRLNVTTHSSVTVAAMRVIQICLEASPGKFALGHAGTQVFPPESVTDVMLIEFELSNQCKVAKTTSPATAHVLAETEMT